MLARDLGFRSRAALYEALTAEELIEWEQVYAIDPWGPERDETLHGVLCSLTDSCHRAKGRPEAPLHYMPFIKSIRNESVNQSEEEMKAVLDSALVSWGD
jgi:hypothetical protein